uniref:DNAX-activation protein 10 n=1 Tax=Astyanax mexicanus TaxID=7994 RepID=A0A8B9JFE0_ASTMX
MSNYFGHWSFWSNSSILTSTNHSKIVTENYFMCKGCVEMNKGLVIAAMFGDILFTLGVILVIYACAKKKNSSPAPQRGNRLPSAPPPPEPDYQVNCMRIKSLKLKMESYKQWKIGKILLDAETHI